MKAKATGASRSYLRQEKFDQRDKIISNYQDIIGNEKLPIINDGFVKSGLVLTN